MIPLPQLFSLALALLSALPGAVSAVEALIADIRAHPDLTPDEKAALLAQHKARVDAEDDAVQDVPVPKPTAPG